MDFTGDWKYWVGAKAVTFTHRQPGDVGNTTDAVGNALKQQVRVQDAAGAWMISARQCVWLIPAKQLTADPVDGDTITDGTDIWVITPDGASQEPLTAVWQCQCVKER
jgi:hypothetical protein